MSAKVVLNPQEFPVPLSRRNTTDTLCTIISGVLAFGLFLTACILFDATSIDQVYFWQLTTTTGQHCSSYTHYPDIRNKLYRQCLESCPVEFHPKYGICWPNHEPLASKYKNSPHLRDISDYEGFKKALLWTAMAALGIGILWLTLVQCAPKHAPLVAVVSAAIVLVVMGLLALLTQSSLFSNTVWKVLIPLACLFLAVIMAVMATLYQKQLAIQGIFLDYASRFLEDSVVTFSHIIIFLLATVGLFALFIFQHCAFSSLAPSNGNFYDFSSPGVLGVLNILEFIWGLQFLKDAFTFCVSGCASDWYWVPADRHYLLEHQEPPTCTTPFSRLIRYHWGSVVMGSFINGFLQIPTLLIELLTCHPGGCCGRAGHFQQASCKCICDTFGLVRTDVYSFINVTGFDFCRSTSECKRICAAEQSFVSSYNPSKHYRFAAHVFTVALCSLLGYLFTNLRVLSIGFWNMSCIVVVSYAILTYFVCVSSDSAEAISTCFFTQHFATADYQAMRRAMPSYRKEMEHRSRRSFSREVTH